VEEIAIPSRSRCELSASFDKSLRTKPVEASDLSAGLMRRLGATNLAKPLMLVR